MGVDAWVWTAGGSPPLSSKRDCHGFGRLVWKNVIHVIPARKMACSRACRMTASLRTARLVRVQLPAQRAEPSKRDDPPAVHLEEAIFPTARRFPDLENFEFAHARGLSECYQPRNHSVPPFRNNPKNSILAWLSASPLGTLPRCSMIALRSSRLTSQSRESSTTSSVSG